MSSKDAPPASGGSKVEMLKGGDYLRVWINKGGNHYLIHLPVTGAPTRRRQSKRVQRQGVGSGMKGGFRAQLSLLPLRPRRA